ncbi:histidine phosphatase superfamily [Paraphoma chrysanthemicola]|uniref:Histidine phosphatase superfamily n=1 Tax=Paraphoma chrysanthemicola TaxID=798071 RepID=A0A8K0W3D9_9PLEO|nr:histidine phosphatase superfamily [Paraphoma chrysanthemicola]
MSASETIPVPAEPPRDFHFKYTVQKGFFLQSEDSTDDTKFNYRNSNFGLIERKYDTDRPDDKQEQWKRFEKFVRHFASGVKEHESVKVLWLGRHGQGWHNVAESKYGTHAWDCYWSALDGADGITWTDANLTTVGQNQALDAHTLWSQQLPLGIPAPETYYVSPLTRTIETADYSFNNLPLPKDKPYKPYIKELLREALGIHTCDRRSTKTHLEATFPHVTFEPGFVDADPLWESDYREPASARRYRLATFLDDVFSSDENVFVSLTSHSGAIASLLEVFGHRRFALETGGVIPVFVKAERVDGKREVPPKEPSDAPPMCDGPPEI